MIDRTKVLPIVEVYPCLQSEGKLAGIPHICIRTTGCVLRCQFSNTDFCDSWYTSWHPDKGKWNLESVFHYITAFPLIKHVFITGGSPTMHPELLRELSQEFHQKGYYITLETEGSKFVEECHIDLLSLSPKLITSNPKIGTKTPLGKEVTGKHWDLHEKNRKNYDDMKKWIADAKDYQFKPVYSNMNDMMEIREIAEILNIPKNMTWLMPAGGTEAELQLRRAEVMEYAWANGYNYTDRFHITAYGEKREV